MIILRLPHLSTRAKLRKHKSNKLADEPLRYRRRAFLVVLPPIVLGAVGKFRFSTRSQERVWARLANWLSEMLTRRGGLGCKAPFFNTKYRQLKPRLPSVIPREGRAN